jgi:hypothetical protein
MALEHCREVALWDREAPVDNPLMLHMVVESHRAADTVLEAGHSDSWRVEGWGLNGPHEKRSGDQKFQDGQ